MIAGLQLSRPWRAVFAVDALLSLLAGLYWMLASEAFVRGTFGVAQPDEVHLELAFKGGIGLLLLGGVFYLGLLRDEIVPRDTFFWLQACLGAMDVLFLGLGFVMLGAAVSSEPWGAAVAQVVVAVGRLVARGMFAMREVPSARVASDPSR